MALSNIFREPRREITESLAGVLPLGLFLWGDYRAALWFHEVTGGEHDGCPWPIGMLFGVIVALVLVFLLFVTHSLGEAVCDALDGVGLRLRPTRRNTKASP